MFTGVPPVSAAAIPANAAAVKRAAINRTPMDRVTIPPPGGYTSHASTHPYLGAPQVACQELRHRRARPRDARAGLSLGHELEGNRVHAVSGVRRREPLADEDVAEVPATGGAFDLDPTAVRVRQPSHSTRDLLIERWPAATGVELRIRDVQRRVAPSADVRALDKEVVVLARERPLGALVDDDPGLLARELIHRSHRRSEERRVGKGCRSRWPP